VVIDLSLDALEVFQEVSVTFVQYNWLSLLLFDVLLNRLVVARISQVHDW
jgi:hypothetical protein